MMSIGAQNTSHSCRFWSPRIFSITLHECTWVRWYVLVWKITKILTKFSQVDSCNIVGNEGEYANNNRRWGRPCVIVASSWQIEVVIVERFGDDAEMIGIIKTVSGTLGKYILSVISSTTLVLTLSFRSHSWACS